VCGLIGTNYQAANQIALNLSTMTFMVALGLSVAATIRVGNQKGYEDYLNLKRVAISFFLLVLIIEIAFAIIFILGSEFFPWLYLSNDDSPAIIETVKIASKLLIVVAVFQVFDGIQVIAQGCLRGIQDVKIPSLICFFSYIIFGLPVMVYLGLYTELKAIGVWIGFLFGLTASSFFLSVRFFMKSDQLIKLK
jgi:MATE family multidrug resistance protein